MRGRERNGIGVGKIEPARLPAQKSNTPARVNGEGNPGEKRIVSALDRKREVVLFGLQLFDEREGKPVTNASACVDEMPALGFEVRSEHGILAAEQPVDAGARPIRLQGSVEGQCADQFSEPVEADDENLLGWPGHFTARGIASARHRQGKEFLAEGGAALGGRDRRAGCCNRTHLNNVFKMLSGALQAGKQKGEACP